ncbi:TonB system transport protein ExbD [Falsirhodobacter sp. alg1]|uniref:TonB system transport protein ExbD n=1 Tax=Falsirhodobacter sp. alg1 TaxID=1472418 RepID=UPI0005EED2FD|nr:TonB system transport protein ExbD [Falsirhodobacter sp. alg1]
MAGGIRDRDDDDLEEAHEINVTPFIDVMLVLLIIFMVAAPISTVDVAVDLPTSNAAPQQRPQEPVYVSVQQDLTLMLGNKPVAQTALAATLDARTGGDKEQRIFLRADQAVPYGDLMQVMNRLRDAGYLKVALVGLDAATAPQGTSP